MSIFDIFKSRWSAGKMTEDDRKRLFWYLKRRTSYTAWKREAEAFDRFAEIFEKQVIEEPIAKAETMIGDTNWESHYPDVLKGQVYYEKGLERLLRGDRTVWLYNDRGILDDAQNISGNWYSELVNHGMRGDHGYDGKYVDELTKSMEEFSKACSDTGYLQPMMADRPALEFWGEWMECVLNNEEYPRNPDPGMRTFKYSLIVYPDPLPPVPEPETEVLIRTGEEVPVFGIYEPQVKDGCMNYLLGSVPAPTLEYEGSDDRPVTWRLIWEDKRYIDGEIPSEESRCFTDVNTAEPYVAPSVANDLLSAKTGELCLRSGNWAVLDDLDARESVLKGKPMPQYAGRDVIWVWSPSR
jgi:hypothetical protein